MHTGFDLTTFTRNRKFPTFFSKITLVKTRTIVFIQIIENKTKGNKTKVNSRCLKAYSDVYYRDA